MRLTIDDEARSLTVADAGGERQLPLYSDAAFDEIARWYVKVGWQQRYSYTFAWFGRPVIQLPDDLVRIQELIYAQKPDLIVETGVAHGGSLVFYASLFEAMGNGRVVGIDVEIRPQNRAAIESHPLSHRIELIEGDSVAPEIVAEAAHAAEGAKIVLVVLDSDHTREHVSAELNAYAPLVTQGSYIVVTDGVMAHLADTPSGKPGWADDNPLAAAKAFAAANPEFVAEPPPLVFNEGTAPRETLTYWPSGYLRRAAATKR
jgi:cephalosporin hydroxylase